MAQQLSIPLLNLSKHTIKAIRKLPQVVAGCFDGPHGKVLLNRYGLRGSRQTGDGLRDDGFQRGRQYERQQQRRDQSDYDDQHELAKIGIGRAQVRFQIYGSDDLVLEQNSLKYAEPVVLE